MELIGDNYESPHPFPPDINFSCINKPYPSKNEFYCLDFAAKKGLSSFPSSGEAIVIIYGTSSIKQQKICYGPSKSNLGWCGTCNFKLVKSMN